ncbi:MAG: chromosomal replication initiator protein DnaA [Chloroflexi bacterium]|nr:chromosomal replication initiator protein DnaA [Chloroflexota bacterium]
MDAKRAWEATLGDLELQMTKATFDTWLKNTTLVSYEDGTFVIGVPNAYAKDWLRHRLLSTIKETLTRICGQTVEIKFALIQPQRQRDAVEILQRPTPGSMMRSEQMCPNLNPRYTFETFVVGNSNRLAHAAAYAAAKNPGKAYNPLFIYGGVGLGKTHLLHAIGSDYVHMNLDVLYIPAETFTNEMINAIRSQTTDDFRNKYRSPDVLLIDDVQFIGGKESTQEELFHTFNALYESGHQIVLSSDRPPKAISPLEERLRSRFEWGLIADIQPPDLETRIAILRVKAEDLSIEIDDDLLELVAHKVTSNIRELEGALNRIAAYAQALHVPATADVVEQALGGILGRPQVLSFTEILQAVASHYDIDAKSLKGKRRDKRVAEARQITMYLAREETKASLAYIGEELGGRDHTTVLHGHDKIESLIEADDQLRRNVFAIREALYKKA